MDQVIALFNRHRIRYLLMGGQALRLEGMPRFSMDWNFLIPPRDSANIERINQLLADEFDVPLIPLGPKGQGFVQTYQTRWGVIQFHLAAPGIPSFEKAEQTSVIHRTETGTRVRCLSAEDLLKTKKAANRPQDQEDILFLEKKRRNRRR